MYKRQPRRRQHAISSKSQSEPSYGQDTETENLVKDLPLSLWRCYLNFG